MTSKPITPTLGIDFDRVDHTRLHPMPLEIDCEDGCKRAYVLAVNAVTAMQCVMAIGGALGIGGGVTPTLAAIDPVWAVSEHDIPALHYGWVVTHGLVYSLMANTVLVGDRLQPGAVAGALSLCIVSDPVHTAAEVERILSATSARRAVCTIAPIGAAVYGQIMLF